MIGFERWLGNYRTNLKEVPHSFKNISNVLNYFSEQIYDLNCHLIICIGKPNFNIISNRMLLPAKPSCTLLCTTHSLIWRLLKKFWNLVLCFWRILKLSISCVISLESWCFTFQVISYLTQVFAFEIWHTIVNAGVWQIHCTSVFSSRTN